MSSSLFQVMQAMVLAVVLLSSLAMAWRKLMPNASRRVLARAAMALDRPGRGILTRWLGRWLQPAEAADGGCGDGGGCASCRGCAPPQEPHVVPLVIKSRRARR